MEINNVIILHNVIAKFVKDSCLFINCLIDIVLVQRFKNQMSKIQYKPRQHMNRSRELILKIVYRIKKINIQRILHELSIHSMYFSEVYCNEYFAIQKIEYCKNS